MCCVLLRGPSLDCFRRPPARSLGPPAHVTSSSHVMLRVTPLDAEALDSELAQLLSARLSRAYHYTQGAGPGAGACLGVPDSVADFDPASRRSGWRGFLAPEQDATRAVELALQALSVAVSDHSPGAALWGLRLCDARAGGAAEGEYVPLSRTQRSGLGASLWLRASVVVNSINGWERSCVAAGPFRAGELGTAKSGMVPLFVVSPWRKSGWLTLARCCRRRHLRQTDAPVSLWHAAEWRTACRLPRQSTCSRSSSTDGAATHSSSLLPAQERGCGD